VGWFNELLKVEREVMFRVGPKQPIIVVERSAGQVVLLGYHLAVDHQAHDPVLLAPIRALAMEGGVGVSVLEHRDTGSLPRYGALKGGKA